MLGGAIALVGVIVVNTLGKVKSVSPQLRVEG
jgi:hypothetical protein